MRYDIIGREELKFLVTVDFFSERDSLDSANIMTLSKFHVTVDFFLDTIVTELSYDIIKILTVHFFFIPDRI